MRNKNGGGPSPRFSVRTRKSLLPAFAGSKLFSLYTEDSGAKRRKACTGALQISVVHFEVSQQHFRNAGGFGVVVALAGVQPALSRSMQRLETALQVSLFDRQKSKIELNDNGRMAVEYAGRIVGEERDRAARIQACDRSRRTILVGSCAPAPLWEISQVLADL